MKTVLLQSSRLVSVVLFMLYGMSMFAQRQDILLNNDWNFRFSHQVQKGTEVRVDLPHTWNAQDALSGKIDYKRELVIMRRIYLFVPNGKENVFYSFRRSE